jgi:hypothetical protein
MVMYWPGSTREGSARKAFTTPQSMRGRVGYGANERSQSAWNSGPRVAISLSEGLSLAQMSGSFDQYDFGRERGGELDIPIPFQPSMGSFSSRALTKSLRPLRIPSRVSDSSREDL